MKKANVIFIALMILSWSAFYALSKWGVMYTASPFVAGLLLRTGAFVFLLIYIIIKGEFKELFKIKNSFLILFFIGLLGYLLDTFANIGFQRSSIATGTILLKLDILMANFISAFIFKDKLSGGDWLFSIIMLIGVILVLDIDYKNFTFNWYDMFFVLSALSVTVNAFVIKRAQTKYKTKNSVIAFYNNFVVLILFLASAIITKDINNLASVNIDDKFYLLFLAGGLAQCLLYVFYYYNLERHPVWLVKVFLLFVPIVSCIIGVIAFNEQFSFLKGFGMVLVLFGAMGIIMLQRKKSSKTVSS